MTLTAAFGLAIWISALAVTLMGTWLTLRHLKSSPPHLDAPFRLYPVSILKPLKGADEGIEDNLDTFFHLDYPEYELIFSVADARDPVVPIVRRLIDKYPAVRSRLI